MPSLPPLHERLLAGPRGRRMLLAVAEASDEAARSTHRPDSFWQRSVSAARSLDPDRGASAASFGWAAHQPEQRSASPEEAAAALAGVELIEATDAVLTAAVAEAVDSARYWQEPDGDDALAAHPAMRRELERVAAHVAASPAAAWWDSPIERGDQWTIVWEGELPGSAPSGTRERLRAATEASIATEAEAAREWPRDAHASFSTAWWSTPDYRLLPSTRALGGTPVRLSWVEDRFSWEEGQALRTRSPERLRVIEITGADDWAQLCRRHPLTVTEQLKYDWLRTTGRVGAWVTPDWASVAEEADAVHLSVAAYLAAAGSAVPVDDERASVIAGWGPDTTYWLTDEIRFAAPVPWVMNDDATWSRAGDDA